MSEDTKTEETITREESAHGVTSLPGADGVMPVSVDPDLEFVKKVTEWGGGDLKACFQCGTCSVVCPLSPDVNPFPRKELVWAQWGLEERLGSDPDLWLCHRCNDCSENCPRGAKTGDVMAALRSHAYQRHAWPSFLGKALNMPLMLPLLLAFPVLVIGLLITAGGHMAAPTGINAELESTYWGNMIEPWPFLDLGFIGAALFAVAAFGVSIKRAWTGFMDSGVQPDVTPKKSLPESIKCAFMDILAHRKFDSCGPAKPRRLSHMLILFGFGGLFLTTALVFVGMYVFGLKTPLPLGHPIKLLGNVSAVTIAVGLVIAIARRSSSELTVATGRNAYQDILFLGIITLVVATGILAEVLRLSTAHTAAAVSYFLHLTFIFFLIFYAPYSKFAHAVFHTTALVWGQHVGRQLKTLPLDRRLPEPGAGDKKAA